MIDITWATRWPGSEKRSRYRCLFPVLAEDPSFEDAAFNKALLEQMQQNEQQQDQQNEEGDGDPSDQQQDAGDQSETEGEQSAPEDASQSDAGDESEQSDNTKKKTQAIRPTRLNPRASPRANLRPQKLRPQRKRSILNSNRPWNNG